MRLFVDSKALRGSVAWTAPLRLKIAVFPPPAPTVAEPTTAAAPAEYDEDGRLWVFRFPRTAPQRYAIDRERIFEYRKRHKLPGEGVRQIRRDIRNAADFYTDVRDIQTHSDVTAQSASPLP